MIKFQTALYIGDDGRIVYFWAMYDAAEILSQTNQQTRQF